MPRNNVYVCIWYMYVFMSVVVTMWGSVTLFVERPLLKIIFLDFEVLEVCFMHWVRFVFCLYCDTWSCRCSCMGVKSILSCI